VSGANERASASGANERASASGANDRDPVRAADDDDPTQGADGLSPAELRARYTSPAAPPDDRNVVRSDGLSGRVAVVTGGGNGIGAGVARRLAAGGAHVVVADVDEAAGEAVASEIGGVFVRCDVGRPEDSEAAVALAEHRWGGLDLIHLNAGVLTGTTMDDFDVDRYRRAMAVNLDGVVFGAVAAVPALRRRGGGTIVATASMAGIAPIPFEPFYSANKHAVIGFCRSLGQQLWPQGIMVQALCPSFADTAILGPAREHLVAAGVPLLTVDEVVEAFVRALDGEQPGECISVVAGRAPEPFEFHGAPARPGQED
jgi:NAD(P)-dependent dehydrogenase (short-subunit alcohol dehydrogenase family)